MRLSAVRDFFRNPKRMCRQVLILEYFSEWKAISRLKKESKGRCGLCDMCDKESAVKSTEEVLENKRKNRSTKSKTPIDDSLPLPSLVRRKKKVRV